METSYALERGGQASYAVAVPTLGQNIERLRTRPGFGKTRRELAKALGLEYQSVYDWEKDRFSTVDLSTLIRLAMALEVSVEQLIDGVDQGYNSARRDLIQSTSDPESWLPRETGAPLNDSTEAGIQLREENARLRKQLQEVSDVARELAILAAAGVESDAVTGERSKIRSRALRRLAG